MGGLPSRIVIREHEFDEQLLALTGDMEQADAFTAGAEYVLARDPLSGMPVSRTRKIWMLPMSPIHGRRVSIYYSFDAESVTLLSIVAFDD